jgi:hypothetical protein
VAQEGLPRPFGEGYDAYSPKGRFHGFAFTSTGKGRRRTCVIYNELLQGKGLRARLRTLETVARVCLLDWGVRMREYVDKRGWVIDDHETESIRRAIGRAGKVAKALRRDLLKAQAAPAGRFLKSDLTHLQRVLTDLENQHLIWTDVLGTDDTGTTPVPFAGFGDS